QAHGCQDHRSEGKPSLADLSSRRNHEADPGSSRPAHLAGGQPKGEKGVPVLLASGTSEPVVRGGGVPPEYRRRCCRVGAEAPPRWPRFIGFRPVSRRTQWRAIRQEARRRLVRLIAERKCGNAYLQHCNFT